MRSGIETTAPLGRNTRPEPGSQRVTKSSISSLSHPRHISIRPNQYCCRSSDSSDSRQLPLTVVPGVDQPDAIRPSSNVDAAGLSEVDYHRPRIMQQCEYTQRSIAG